MATDPYAGSRILLAADRASDDIAQGGTAADATLRVPVRRPYGIPDCRARRRSADCHATRTAAGRHRGQSRSGAEGGTVSPPGRRGHPTPQAMARCNGTSLVQGKHTGSMARQSGESPLPLGGWRLGAPCQSGQVSGRMVFRRACAGLCPTGAGLGRPRPSPSGLRVSHPCDFPNWFRTSPAVWPHPWVCPLSWPCIK